MFGRDKDKKTGSHAVTQVGDAPATTAQEPVPESVPGRPAPKGRPTPKQRDQVAQRRKPLVPADREAAKREAKQQARVDRVNRREAMARGVESALPPRDRGPIKRFIRDSIDSRLTMGEMVMPLVLVMLVISLIPNRSLQTIFLILVWLIILVSVLDAVIRWQRIKRRIKEKFGEEPPKGCASYAVMRSFQMRMTRMPRPQVKRGDKVV